MKLLPFALGVAATLSSFEAAAVVVDLTAFDLATVQPAGPRPDTSGKRFFNVQGAGNGQFASYGVARFDTSGIAGPGLTGATINSAQITLAQSNAFFTGDGEVAVYFSDLDVVDIQPGSSIAFDDGEANAFANDFTDAALLASDTFTEKSDGATDTFTVTNNLQLLADGDGVITLVFSAFEDPDVSATYAGLDNSDGPAPTLTLDFQPVPLPPAVWLFGSATAALVGWRRGHA